MVTYPKDWEYQSLRDCCIDKLSYGINAPAIPHSSQYPSYLRITDIDEDGTYKSGEKKSVATNETEKYSLRSGDIVLARTGASTGKSYLYDERDGCFVYAGFLIKASIDEKRHNAKYIVSQLRTSRYWAWVACESMRSGQPGINGKQYSSFLIPVASKEEQDDIAETLSCMDEHIANLTELIEKKKGIRDGALEDLVSGRTRLEGFSGEWEEHSFNDFLKIKRGASPRPIEHYVTQNANGVNWIKIGDAPKYGKHIVATKEKITESGAMQSVRVYPGDFLLSNSMSFGRPYILSIAGCIHDGWLRLFDFQDTANDEYLYYLLSSDSVQRQYQSYAAGSGVQNLNKEVVKKVVVRLPSLPEQKAIAETLSCIDTEIASLEEEKDKMLQIKAGAMDDLLTGRIRLTRQGG